MRTDLLVQILNMMPPEELGKIISQIQQPQAYLSNELFGQQEGYRGNLPVQMRKMQPGVGGGSLPPVRSY
jgi:hypothetical protein